MNNQLLRHRRNNRSAPGFILVLTLFLLTISIAVTTRLFMQVNAYRTLMSQVPQRLQARQLATSTLLVVKDSLMFANTEDGATELFEWLLTQMNRWNTIQIRDEIGKNTGYEGTVYLYVNVEDGKFNLNAPFDAEKHFAPMADAPYRYFIEQMKKALPKTESTIFETIEGMLKKREEPLSDLTAIFSEPLPSANLPLFPRPLETASLFDYFTVAPARFKSINPFFLSKGMSTLLELKELPTDLTERRKLASRIARQIVSLPYWKIVWQKFVEPVVGKSIMQLNPEAQHLLDGTGMNGARTISVICYSKVGDVLQGLCAILQRTVEGDKGGFLIKRLYWIV